MVQVRNVPYSFVNIIRVAIQHFNASQKEDF